MPYSKGIVSYERRLLLRAKEQPSQAMLCNPDNLAPRATQVLFFCTSMHLAGGDTVAGIRVHRIVQQTCIKQCGYTE